MEKIFDKLSSYNVLNNIIPGAAFFWLCKLFRIVILPTSSTIENLLIYYFCGMVVSRIGSLVVEKVCIEVKFVSYAPKKDYIDAAKKDELIPKLLETSNLYRTCAGMSLMIAICKLYINIAHQFILYREITFWVVIILMFVLFVCSFRKQTNQILSRVHASKENKVE
jgi:hypothetical protein